MSRSARIVDSTAPLTRLSISERVMGFCRRQHPAGTAKRVAADTSRATRGRGIPAETITNWARRGSDPSAAHLLTLGITYGFAFLSEVFVEVDQVEAERAARDLLAAEARVAALKTCGAR